MMNDEGWEKCLVCGHPVPEGDPYKGCCTTQCWAEENGEVPEETHDKIVLFEGWRVGQ